MADLFLKVSPFLEKFSVSAFSSLAAPQIHFMIKQNLANIHEYIFCIIFFLDLFADIPTGKSKS